MNDLEEKQTSLKLSDHLLPPCGGNGSQQWFNWSKTQGFS